MLPEVTMHGYVGRDAEMRYLSDGNAKADFSIACSRKRRDGDDITEWVNCVLWRDKAEKFSQYITKGRQLFLKGDLRTRQWVDDEGRKHYRTEVHINHVDFLDGASKESKREANGDEYDDLPF